jgi:hypothetical protein
MVTLKKCPRCDFDLAGISELHFCPNCGYDLLDVPQKPNDVPERSISPISSPSIAQQDLLRPLNGCWYLLIGLIGGIVLSVAPFAIINGSRFSGLFSDFGVAVVFIIALLAIYLSIWILGTKGMYGKVGFYGFLNIFVLSLIPIGGWVATYYFGKGLYMAVTKQRLLIPRSASKAGMIFLLICFLVPAIVVLFVFLSSPSVSVTSTPYPTARIYSTSTSESAIFLRLTRAAATSNALPSCYRWDQITTSMKGQKICVRGMIYNFIQTRKVGTRYEFTDKPNSFFVYSALWEIYNTNTGKTLGPGTCLEVTDIVRVQSGVPYMDLDQSISGNVFTDLKVYPDASACQ